MRTTAATGTLTQKIHSQPRYFVRMPPIRTPAAAPLPPTAPQAPSALLRSLPSVNVTEMIDRAAGVTIAAPSPWTPRAAINIPDEVESPQTSEARPKSASPPMKTSRRPSKSAARPPRSRNPPYVSP